MKTDDLVLFQMPDDGFGYKKCWACGKEKTPLEWIWNKGRLIHCCIDCIKEREKPCFTL